MPRCSCGVGLSHTVVLEGVQAWPPAECTMSPSLLPPPPPTTQLCARCVWFVRVPATRLVWSPLQGEMLVSIEVVPVAIAKKLPAGMGRSAPNAHPELPPPTGRLKFVRCRACCCGSVSAGTGGAALPPTPLPLSPLLCGLW